MTARSKIMMVVSKINFCEGRMGDEKEHNNYKDDLAAAKTVIETQRSQLVGEGGIGHAIRNQIAGHGGWVCTAADDWVTDFAGKCTPIKTEFDTAWDEVDTAWAAEPLKVDAGNWRGDAYNAPSTGPQQTPY